MNAAAPAMSAGRSGSAAGFGTARRHQDEHAHEAVTQADALQDAGDAHGVEVELRIQVQEEADRDQQQRCATTRAAADRARVAPFSERRCSDSGMAAPMQNRNAGATMSMSVQPSHCACDEPASSCAPRSPG